MNKNFLLLIFSFISLNLVAQENILKGYVSDSLMKTPVEGAIVYLKSENTNLNNNLTKDQTQTVTDADGTFIIKNLPYGNYNIKVYHEGYKSKELIYSFTKTAGNIFNLELSQSEISTGEIKVTSTRYSAILKDIPLPIEVVSEDEILRKPYQTIGDALEYKPGISVTKDGTWATDVSIRGLSRANVVMNIDGNRVETANDLAARLSLVDLNDVERVEVIKGGVSSLYGTGALGGVVNVYTKNGDFSNNFNFGASLLGGYNSVNKSPNSWLSLFASNDKFFAKLSGSIRYAENTMTPQGELPNSQFKDNNVSLNLGVRPLNNHEFRLSYQRYRALDAGIPGGGTLFPTNAIVKYPQEDRDMVSGEYKIKNLLKPLKELSVKYFYQSILRDVENIPNQVQTVRTSTGKIKQKVYVLSITPNARHYTNGIQLKSDWQVGKYNYIIAGVDFWMRALDSRRERNQRIENYDTTSGSITSTVLKTIGEKPIPDADYRSIGIYAQDEVRAMQDKLKINFGGRVDQIRVTNSNTLQPVYDITNGTRNESPAGQKLIWTSKEVRDVSWSANAGAIYSITKNYDITLNLSRSFRSPSLEERYQYIDLGSSLRVGNPELLPEKGYFVDLGLRVWRDKVTFTGNAFFNTFEDLVAELPGTYENRPAYIKTNIGKARLYGYEFEFMYNFYRSLVLYGNLSYVRGEDSENNTNLPAIPPLNMKAGLKFSLYNYVNFDINTVLYEKQDYTAAGEQNTPGYGVFNIGLSTSQFKFSYYGIMLMAGVENIFDKEYRNHLSSNRGLVVIEPGRNFYFKLKINI